LAVDSDRTTCQILSIFPSHDHKVFNKSTVIVCLIHMVLKFKVYLYKENVMYMDGMVIDK